MESITAWALTYYRRSWQKHIAAKTRSVKSINFLNFMFNLSPLLAMHFRQRDTGFMISLSKKAAGFRLIHVWTPRLTSSTLA